MKNTDQFCGLCEKTVRASSRREFLEKAGLGFGMLGAGYLLARDADAATWTARASNPFAPKPPDFPAQAKNVIFLFMHGGPSHVDTFDPKPLLAKLNGKTPPPSFGKVDFQFTKMEKAPLLASSRTFRKYGQSGIEISDLFRQTAQFADDMAVIRSCYHDGFTHSPPAISTTCALSRACTPRGSIMARPPSNCTPAPTPLYGHRGVRGWSTGSEMRAKTCQRLWLCWTEVSRLARRHTALVFCRPCIKEPCCAQTAHPFST